MSAARPDVSIVTVSYNSEACLGECLHSAVAAARDVRFEHIVVDNASRSRAFLERVPREFPGTVVVENEKNLGFAAGCNAGIARAAGRYILLLNPDARLEPGALDDLVAVLDARPDAAIVGTPLVYADGRDQRCGGRAFPTPLLSLFGRTSLLTRILPRNRISGRFAPVRDPSRSEPYEVDWVSGACMLVRREAIDAVGPPDPGYFLMWEDADWCFRMHQAGWKVLCHHEPKAVHLEGGSRHGGWRSLWLSTVFFHRGAYRYYRKHMNSRRYDPTHLLVGAGLAGRALLLLAGRSAARIAGAGPAPAAAPGSGTRDIGSTVAR